MDQRLGERGFRRIVRCLLFWQIADAGPGTVHQEITGLQDGSDQGAGADFPWQRGPQRSVRAKLDVFPHAAVARKSSGEIRYFSWRAARATQADASAAQTR